jgi:hypothetical protein
MPKANSTAAVRPKQCGKIASGTIMAYGTRIVSQKTFFGSKIFRVEDRAM